MKKIFYLASIAALAFSSCAKDETTEAQIGAVNGGSKITAAVVADDTRTSLDENLKYSWSAGDQLGVYEVKGAMANAAFTLSNDSDGKAVGVFTSQHEILNPEKEYLAVYPRHQIELFSSVGKVDNYYYNLNTGKKVAHVDYRDVKVNIPATQYYRDGSFYTMTAPSVSTNFVVEEDGSQLSMQPVADYLFVNIMSVEPFSTLTLRLYDRAAGKYLNIAGTANLAPYYVKGEKSYRYYMPETADEAANKAITLKINENSANVTCHDVNTYVFVVPGGILGMGDTENIEAWIWVDNTTSDNRDLAAFCSMKDTEAPNDTTFPVSNKEIRSTNAQLNYYTQKVNGENKNFSRMNADDEVVMQLENQVFYMNPKSQGVRTHYTYNPNDDVLIHNQWELLEYITEYTTAKGKDAFLCKDGAFDFSKQAMEDLATEMQDLADYGKYQDLIDDYLAEGFPCIANYNNNFVGNGAVIENIFMPLQNKDGIFGNVAANKTISDVKFANIEAWSETNKVNGVDVTTYGTILAQKFEGKVENVVVENVIGAAVMGEANVAAFNGIEFKNVSNLEHIFDNLVADNNLDLTETWASVEGVTGEVFHKITPADNKGVTTTTKDLNVITIAEGDAATYANLTAGVDYNKDENAVAVVIDGVSYWTGDKFASTTAAGTSAPLNAYKKIQYAEQLAADHTYAYLVGNMDMNWDNLKVVKDGVLDIEKSIAWKTANYTVLQGNGTSTIKNIQMIVKGEGNNKSVAPFSVEGAYNVALENVGIDIITNLETETVPSYIAGFSASAAEIDGVTIENLKINAYRHDGTQNTQANYGSHYTFVGWLVANANDIKVTNSTVTGVESNVKGISALVGRIAITDTKTSSHIKNSSASSVEFTMANADAPAAIAKFAKFEHGTKYNVYGTAVAMVYNGTNSNSTIKFAGVGQPKFMFANYNADKGINVVYVGDTVYDTLHNDDEF